MKDQRKAALPPLAGASASVTVHDRASFTASVSPEQAAAYVRAKFPHWRQDTVTWRGHDAEITWITFSTPHPNEGDGISIPARVDFRDYARRMVELVDALVALGCCAQQPSQVLAAMAAIRCGGWAADGDGCWLSPKHDGACVSHAMLLDAD